MRREIKFRAWNKSTNQMVKIEPFVFVDSFMDNTHFLSSGVIEGDFNTPLREIELMQFTGHQDKDRTDIYEHDLVEDDKYIYKVEYCAQHTEFRLNPVKSKKNVDWLIMEIDWQKLGNGYLHRKDLKIVGNIHDDKELLKN